jgi:hypothetical protein
LPSGALPWAYSPPKFAKFKTPVTLAPPDQPERSAKEPVDGLSNPGFVIVIAVCAEADGNSSKITLATATATLARGKKLIVGVVNAAKPTLGGQGIF